MRQMRATPENRQVVYNALRAYQYDTAQAASVETLASRSSLSPDVVESCLDALVETKLVVRSDAISGYPLYLVAVSSGGHAKAPTGRYPQDAHKDCQSGERTGAQSSVAGGG